MSCPNLVPMQAAKRILIIGGTGMIGQPVTKALLQSGHQVTLLARNPAKAQALFPGATILKGDVFDPLSLLPAFEEQDAVYISLSPPRTARPSSRMPEREGIDNIIAVAKKTGLPRLVLLSSLVQRYNNTNGFHWWVFDIKVSAVEKLKQCGIPYTIFYPSTFMESFDQLLMKGSNLLLAGKSKAPMHFIAAADYAQQVLRYFNTIPAGNQEYIVQGPAAYNWDTAARLFINHYNQKKLRILKAPMAPLKFMGSIIPIVNYGVKITDALNNYPEQFGAADTWRQLGEPPTTIEAYAAKR